MRRDVITIVFFSDCIKTTDVYGKILGYNVSFICEFYRPMALVKTFPDRPLKFAISGHNFIIVSVLHCVVFVIISMTI